jgi:hypothetical protein
MNDDDGISSSTSSLSAPIALALIVASSWYNKTCHLSPIARAVPFVLVSRARGAEGVALERRLSVVITTVAGPPEAIGA